MRLIAQIEHSLPQSFVIQYDRLAGYYMYFYAGDFCVQDDLQDTFARAVASALENYDVPAKAWRQSPADPAKWIAEMNSIQQISFAIEGSKKNFNILIYRGSKLVYSRAKPNLGEAKHFGLEKFHIPLGAWKDEAA